MKLEIDTRQMTRALNEYEKATGKDAMEILNRAARNLAYRAAGKTPKAKAGRIRAHLFRDPRLRFALTSISLKKQGVGILKSPLFAKAVTKMVARRMASAGYLRAGWAEAVAKLGGTFRGTRTHGKGFAKKATVMSLVAEIINTVPGIEKIGTEALQAAIDFVAADMINHAQGKLAQRAKAHSP